MRNISISQLIIAFLVAILLFSDFSKITKSFHNIVKNSKIYKNLKKK
jgi:Sec-independent protein translocase protein TatA